MLLHIKPRLSGPLMGRISRIIGVLLFTYGVLNGVGMLFIPDTTYTQYYLYYLVETGIFILLGIYLFNRTGRKKLSEETTTAATDTEASEENN